MVLYVGASEHFPGRRVEEGVRKNKEEERGGGGGKAGGEGQIRHVRSTQYKHRGCRIKCRLVIKLVRVLGTTII